MKCGSLARFLSDYLDHELPLRLCRLIQGHRRECPACRAFLRSLEKTVLALKKQDKTRPSSGLRARLRRRLERIARKS